MKHLLLVVLMTLQTIASDAFVSAEDLTTILDNKKLVILDVTDKEEYEKGHIVNALRSDIENFRDEVIMHKEIKSEKEIEKLMRSFGIDDDSEIVLYGHGKEKELLKCTYMAMAFITHGAKNVSVLDGGYDAWLYESPKLISTTTPKQRVGNFTANFDKNRIVDMQYVKDRIGKIRMIDARPPRYYYGSLLSGGVERYGHIPNAISSFWGDKFRNDNTIREEEIIEEMFIAANGLQNKDEEVILYCTGGLETSANWYILSQFLGFKNAKIYDGSMRDWGNVDHTPLVRYRWESIFKATLEK